MRQVVADHVGVGAGMRQALPVGGVGEEAAHPVDIATLGAVGVMPRPDPPAQLLEGLQRIRAAVTTDDSVLRLLMPVAPLQEVHEVDAQGLLGLADLPVLTSRLAFEVFGERADRSASESLEAGRFRNRRTQRTQWGAAFGVTSLAFSRNSPNSWSDVSISCTGPTADDEERPIHMPDALSLCLSLQIVANKAVARQGYMATGGGGPKLTTGVDGRSPKWSQRRIR